MGKTPSEIETDIVRARDRLGENLNALEQQIRQTVDWRSRFRQNPMPFVGAAFGVGALIGLFTVPSRPKCVERRVDRYVIQR